VNEPDIDDDGDLDDSQMRTCLRCGHRQCPMCPDWCDVLLHDGDDDGFIPESEKGADGEPDWPVLCCGGACVYAEDPPP
jgi:hypothetical protein